MDFAHLQALFIANPTAAIEEAQKSISTFSGFDSFQSFYSYHHQHSHFIYCPKPFNPTTAREITVYCSDCSLLNGHGSNLCLDCFLNGDHAGHNYLIVPNSNGFCQCGNKDCLKREGFCQNHSGNDTNLNEFLEGELGDFLKGIVFKSSFNALKKINDVEKAREIVSFLISFFELGDGFRRLFVLSLIEENDLIKSIYNIGDVSPSFISQSAVLFSYLMHDHLFLNHFSNAVNKLVLDKAIKEYLNDIPNLPDVKTKYEPLIPFILECYSESLCRYNIESNNWNWVNLSIEILKGLKEVLILHKKYKYRHYPKVLSIAKYVHNMSAIQPNEKTQDFFDKLFTQVINHGAHEEKDTIIIESYNKFAFSRQIYAYIDFVSNYNYIINAFKSKKDLKFDKLIVELDKNIDINPLFLISKNSIGNESGMKNENDRLIYRFIMKKDQSKSSLSLFEKFKTKMKDIFDSYPAKYYKSFLNGASFFLVHPLYDSFSLLLRVDDLCRIKIARFLCQEKYQPLRIKLGIIALKKLLSLVFFKMELFRFKNFSLLVLFYEMCEKRKDIQFDMIPISALQLLIGLECNEKEDKTIDDDFILKEFFAFELAREIGLFDEEVYTKKKQLYIFIFFYVSLMLVVDRVLFNFNINKILEEQIIFSLKKGDHSIDKLNIYKSNFEDPIEYCINFNEILMKVSTKSTKNDESNNNNNENDNNNTHISLADLNDDNKSEDEEEDEANNEKAKNENRNLSLDTNDSDESNNHKRENQNSYIKPVNFYLKEGIECKAISSVNLINDQRSYLNTEISKNPNKLIKIQDFEPEETYFFHSIQNNENDNDNDNDSTSNTDGLNIHLKQFLMTPTILAVVYDSLRFNSGPDSPSSELNDHLAMNILILISRFIKEEEDNKILKKSTSFNQNTKIKYISLSDFISKLKRIIFNYRVSGKEEEKGFIDNTLNSITFISFIKAKIEAKNHPPKSIIDILMDKGQIGQETLHQISSNIHIDDLDKIDKKEKNNKNKEDDIRAAQKQRANKLKEEIMNKYSNIRNQYHFSDSFSESLSISSNEIFSPNKDVCSLCSESKAKEILCYPLYTYRTKFPFIFDKPPLFKNEEVSDIAVYDNEEDFDKDVDIVNFLKEKLSINGDSTEEDLYKLSNFKKIMTKIFDQQQNEKEDLLTGEKTKRVTLGAKFVIQFGICPHPVHRKCVKGENFICPIDRSMKNSFLPSLDDIPINIIFKDVNTFELNPYKGDEESLLSSIINSISEFITKFSSFFDCLKDDSINIFIELLKSVSGLIETYEIRVRNLPDSLDSTKTKILSRNFFLTVWYAYRIQKKPKLTMISKEDSTEIDTDKRLTDFQKFIELFIELDDINNPEIEKEVKQMAHSIIDSMISESDNLKRKEKEICLFLRRVCLAEYFLLDINVNTDEKEIIDWDIVLTAENLSERYDIKFTSIDVTKSEDFEFKPFIFANFPKEFLRLSQSPYNLPIQNLGQLSFFNILDFNYLIKYYDDFDDTNENNENDESSNNENEIKRYRRSVQICEDEVLPFFMAFYGKLHYPSLLMFTGLFSSQIFLIDQSQAALLDTFYVDKSGCPDIEHVRFQPLFLNEERYEKLIDQILSGDFSYNLSSLNDTQI